MIFSKNKLDSKVFDLQNSEIFHYTNNENFNINVFFIIADLETIKENWKIFSNTVAANYQNSDYMSGNVEFEKWNFYTIYVSSEKFTKELKNLIENDRFSSRKIVEDNFSEKFNDNKANKLIIKHITNSDLSEIVGKTLSISIDDYVPANISLWQLINKEERIIGDKKAQKLFIDKLIQDEN